MTGAAEKAFPLWPRCAATVLIALALFAMATAAGMVRRPSAFRHYREGTRVWDAVHFHTIAARGYCLEDPGLGNYFPLWPLVLRAVFARETLERTGLPAALLAFALFAISLAPVSCKVLRGCGATIGAGVVLAWAVNPMSIFHALSYSESLFCLWAGCFLVALPDRLRPEARRRDLAVAGLCAFLMGLTRNVAIQMVASGVFASLMCVLTLRPRRNYLVLTAVIAAASAVAFSIYGLWNLRHYGNFWHVFTIQSHWEKRVGVDWTLLWRPKTWTPSSNVLLWDVLAFYLPFAVLMYAMISVARSGFDESTKRPSFDYTFWFSAAFAACHSGIVWMTQPDFHSLARYVFAVPFFFVALGGVLSGWPRRVALALLWVGLVLSAIYLANWWGRFARLSWLG
jgi:hypothetical protein